MPPRSLKVPLLAQPTDTVCGPTCLQAMYRYFGREEPLERVIDEIPSLPDGGTLAVHLGCHALRRGFSATIYTNDLQTFDPTWFRESGDLSSKLRAQAEVKTDEKLRIATEAYLQFLDRGGKVRLEGLTLDLLRYHLDRKLPILAGLSATYLYDCPRELADGTFDDVAGEPAGHFVVIQGYDQDTEHVLIADPLPDNPGFGQRNYSVDIQRLLAAILLGIVTYDANLLVLAPGA